MKRKAYKSYTLDDVRKTMTSALKELESIYLDESADPDQKIRAINSLSSLANSYARISETADLEERITQLEENMKGNGKSIR